MRPNAFVYRIASFCNSRTEFNVELTRCVHSIASSDFLWSDPSLRASKCSEVRSIIDKRRRGALAVADQPADESAMVVEIDKLASAENPHWTKGHQAKAEAYEKKRSKKRQELLEIAGPAYFGGAAAEASGHLRSARACSGTKHYSTMAAVFI